MLFCRPVFSFSAPFCLVLGITALLLVACTNPQDRKSVVAEVNGAPILFSELDGMRNILFAPLSGDGTPPDDATLREQYAHVMRHLILHELIAQHLKKAKIAVDEAQLVKEELLVQSDYPPGTFMDVLMAQGVSPALWHKAMMDRVRMQIFTSQVLRPAISISSSEFEFYFNAHKEDFLVPEQWHLFRISGTDKARVEKARDSLLSGQDASFLNGEQNLSIRDIRMGKDRLPENIAKALDVMAPMTAGPVTEVEGDLVTYILLEKTPATPLDTIETYKRVEHILMEGKIQVALNAWFAQNLKSAKVRIAPTLLSPSLGEESRMAATSATSGLSSINGTEQDIDEHDVPDTGNGVGSAIPSNEGADATSAPKADPKTNPKPESKATPKSGAKPGSKPGPKPDSKHAPETVSR